MILLDTRVVSEPFRAAGGTNVLAWIDAQIIEAQIIEAQIIEAQIIEAQIIEAL